MRQANLERYQRELVALYKSIITAKEQQSSIVDNESLSIPMKLDSRKELVNIWNALDICGESIYKILSLENISPTGRIGIYTSGKSKKEKITPKLFL